LKKHLPPTYLKKLLTYIAMSRKWNPSDMIRHIAYELLGSFAKETHKSAKEPHKYSQV